MSVAELTLKQAREKLAAKQDDLGKVLEQAKASDGQHDFSKVTFFGPEVKGTIAIVDKFNQLNSEANELAEHAEKLEAAEKTARDYADREKVRGRFPLGSASKGDERRYAIKSIGEMIGEQKSYKDWVGGGCNSGITFGLEDAMPSDLMAKAGAFPTLGTKALMSTTAGFAPESVRAPGFTEMATRPIQLLDILPFFPTDQAAYKYMEETTRTSGAKGTAEGAAFGESAFGFTERTNPVQKITDSVPVTDEQLEDVSMIEGYLNGRLMFGVRQKLDEMCIAGDGVSPNIKGIKNVAGIQTQARGADPVMDTFFKAMTKIRLVGRAVPTHHLMHPNDWQAIRLTRTADGIYIFGSPTDAGPDRLWGLPVVQQDAVDEGWGMTGSFQPQWISLFERRGVTVAVGYVDDQFGKGQRTIRADMRAVLVTFRPAAFCEATGLGE